MVAEKTAYTGATSRVQRPDNASVRGNRRQGTRFLCMEFWTTTLRDAVADYYLMVSSGPRPTPSVLSVNAGRRTDELHEPESFPGRMNTKVEDNGKNNEDLHPPDSPSEEDEEDEQATKKRKVWFCSILLCRPPADQIGSGAFKSGKGTATGYKLSKV